MLTNFDLEAMAHKYKLLIRSICMKDKLPKRVRDGNYIINLQSSDNGRNHGTHWTALVLRGDEALFFDPFGVYPSTEIRDFVKRRPGTHLAFTTKDIQDLKSDNCGLFCMGFLLMTDSNPDLFRGAKDYMSFFSSTNTKGNDKIIKALLPDAKCRCSQR